MKFKTPSRKLKSPEWDFRQIARACRESGRADQKTGPALNPLLRILAVLFVIMHITGIIESIKEIAAALGKH